MPMIVTWGTGIYCNMEQYSHSFSFLQSLFFGWTANGKAILVCSTGAFPK